MKTFVNISVELGDNVRNGAKPLRERAAYLVFAVMAVRNVSADKRMGLVNSRAMGWPDNGKFALQDAVKAVEIVSHMAVWRADDTC